MDDVTSFKENAYNTLEAKQSDKPRPSTPQPKPLGGCSEKSYEW